jgi:hypothetical protein
MKTIPLSDGFEALVDDDDYDMLTSYEWCCRLGHQSTSNRYVLMRCKDTIYMHRFLLGIKGNRQVIVDHINRNTLDNRRRNLRIVTPSQNAQNRKKHTHYKGKPTSSKYKGVRKIKNPKGKQPWNAVITHKGKRRNLGNFYTEEDAAKKYDLAAIEMFGDFASTNFPVPSTP